MLRVLLRAFVRRFFDFLRDYLRPSVSFHSVLSLASPTIVVLVICLVLDRCSLRLGSAYTGSRLSHFPLCFEALILRLHRPRGRRNAFYSVTVLSRDTWIYGNASRVLALLDSFFVAGKRDWFAVSHRRHKCLL